MYELPNRSRMMRLPAMAVIVLAGLSLMVPQALAQGKQPQKPRNLIEFLFGTRKPKDQQPAPPQKTTARPKRSKAPPTPPAEAKIQIIEKSPAARTVLVVGDFMGSGLAEGLNTVFAQDSEIRIADRTNGSSGLARDDYFNWPKEIEGMIETEKPAAIVVMLGANDRQQMTVDDTSEQPLTKSWIKEYEARAQAFASTMQTSTVPFIWVGQPSFKPKNLLSDMLTLNGIYRKAAEGASGMFIDIWDGFVDANGAFITSGPDINGQSVRLRSGDGIHLSKAGKRKVAFYAEKPLYRILGIAPSGAPIPDEATLPKETVQHPGRPLDRTAPISLSDPELDGGTELLGKMPGARGEPQTATERLATKSIAPDAAAGRADDFWAKKPTLIGPQLPSEITLAE